MKKTSQLEEFRHISKRLRLRLFIEEPISPSETILPIVNLRERSLSLVSRAAFSNEQKFVWTDDVLKASPLSPEEKRAFDQAGACKKALLQTDYGFGITNLIPIKKGSFVTQYEGLFYENCAFEDSVTYSLLFMDEKGDASQKSISAKKYRGFGGFIQHHPSAEESQAYQIFPKSLKFARDNLRRVYFKERIFFTAEADLPPLSLIGMSYGYYWCGKKDPVLFNLTNGFSIPKTRYSFKTCYINFRDLNFNEESDAVYSIEALNEIAEDGYSMPSKDIIFKKKHLLQISDVKDGKLLPKQMYSQVFLLDLKAEDYQLVANSYFKGHAFEDAQSPKHLQRVADLYEKARQLFEKNGDIKKAGDCQQRIKDFKLMQKIVTSKEDKNLPFRRAAASGNMQLLQLLIIAKADINSQGMPSKKTSLHHAAANGHTEVCGFLLLFGANQKLKDQNGKTPIDYAKIGSPIHSLLTGPQNLSQLSLSPGLF